MMHSGGALWEVNKKKQRNTLKIFDQLCIIAMWVVYRNEFRCIYVAIFIHLLILREIECCFIEPTLKATGLQVCNRVLYHKAGPSAS